MKHRLSDILTVVLFGGFLLCMTVLVLTLPPEDFSEKEKRYLEKAPELTAESLLSGEFGEQAEEYVADHVPGRDLFVMLSAYYDLYSNRQVTKEVYLAADGRLVEAPVVMDAQTVERNMNAVNSFASSSDVPVELMIVPSAGFMYEDTLRGLHDPYADGGIIAGIYARAGDNVSTVDLLPAITAARSEGEIFYRTDHHWTAFGAYTAYREYMSLRGRSCPDRSEYTVESYSGFRGSTYSRSGLWMTPAEDIELWKRDIPLTVTNAESETAHEGVFYEERLCEPDKYTVYLDGNHSLVRIDNAADDAEGKLLVIRDSYSNCLGTFLAGSYETVVLVDLRYYRKPVSGLLLEGGFTDVLVCYSIGNFMTDSNIAMLR